MRRLLWAATLLRTLPKIIGVSSAGFSYSQPMNLAYLIRSEEVVSFGNLLTGVEKQPREV